LTERTVQGKRRQLLPIGVLVYKNQFKNAVARTLFKNSRHSDTRQKLTKGALCSEFVQQNCAFSTVRQ